MEAIRDCVTGHTDWQQRALAQMFGQQDDYWLVGQVCP